MLDASEPGKLPEILVVTGSDWMLRARALSLMIFKFEQLSKYTRLSLVAADALVAHMQEKVEKFAVASWSDSSLELSSISSSSATVL